MLSYTVGRKTNVENGTDGHVDMMNVMIGLNNLNTTDTTSCVNFLQTNYDLDKVRAPASSPASRALTGVCAPS